MRGAGLPFLTALAAAASSPRPLAAQHVDLSPARWTDAERARFDSLNGGRQRTVPLAQGTQGAISGTTGAMAVRAGLEALKQGGTAMDAVLVHALADIVIMAQTVVSHAGIMTLAYYEASTGRVHTMNAGWNTVRGETDPLSVPVDTGSGRAVLVPGFMAGAEAAHRRFGKLPWAALFEPAIYLAEHGVTYTAQNAALVGAKKAVIETMPATKAVFTKPDDSWYQAGDRFVQPALARTLRAVATEGASYMYTGDWGRKLVEQVRAHGGRLTLEDLAAYQPIWSEPVRARFREYEIAAVPPPTWGGVNLVEALNLVEEADLRSLGHYTTSAVALERLLAISRVGELQGTAMLGMLIDPPADALVRRYTGGPFALGARATDEHARSLWARMQRPEWREFDRQLFMRPIGTGHSDAVVAADRFGNVAALLHTSNATTWGRLGLMIDGVGISDVGGYQQKLVARVDPGARLPDPTNPAIVLRDGKPVLASSSIGIGLHEQTLQSIVNVLEYGMGPKTAAETPQFLRPVGPQRSRSAVGPTPDRKPSDHVFVEDGFAPALLDELRGLGRSIVVVPRAQGTGWTGAWVGLTIDQATGLRYAAVQGVSNGWALAH